MKKLAIWEINQINQNTIKEIADDVNFNLSFSIVSRKGKRTMYFQISEKEVRGTTSFEVTQEDARLIIDNKILKNLLNNVNSEKVKKIMTLI